MPLISDSIFSLGLNHRTAAVDVRERFALDLDQRCGVRKRLSSSFELPRNVLLSTCNRTEIYGIVEQGPPDEEFLHGIERLLFPDLGAEFRPFRFTGWAAIFHVFRVSAGLDSMVVGESEILGQVRSAFEETLEDGEPGRLLQDLFREAMVVGKRVRSETQLGEGSLSVASTAVKLAAKVVGSLEGKRGLVIGAGATGVLTARHMKAAGIGSLTVLNRTVERAEAAAIEIGAVAGGLDRLVPALGEADVVVACIQSPEPLIDAGTLRKIDARTRCLIDISVPRCVDASAGEHAGTFCFDIDDLTSLIETAREERKSQIVAAESIIVHEVQKLLARQTYAAMTPLVTELKTAFASIMEDTIASSGAATEREATERLTRRLLGSALDTLKKSSRRQSDHEQIRAAYEVFVKELEGQ